MVPGGGCTSGEGQANKQPAGEHPRHTVTAGPAAAHADLIMATDAEAAPAPAPAVVKVEAEEDQETVVEYIGVCCQGACHQHAAPHLHPPGFADEFLGLVAAVDAAPASFDAWRALLAAADKGVRPAFQFRCRQHARHRPLFLMQGDMDVTRKWHQQFLASYPLCYGYWNKVRAPCPPPGPPHITRHMLLARSWLRPSGGLQGTGVTLRLWPVPRLLQLQCLRKPPTSTLQGPVSSCGRSTLGGCGN